MKRAFWSPAEWRERERGVREKNMVARDGEIYRVVDRRVRREEVMGVIKKVKVRKQLV